MLATHNSMNYLKSTNPLFNMFSFTWRCQDTDYKQQCQDGIAFFDIRLIESNGEFKFAHGYVTLKGEDPVTVINYISQKQIYFRIVIERGDTENIVKKFKRYKYCLGIWKKKGWVELYKSDTYSTLTIKDYSYVPFQSNKSIISQLWSFIKNLTTIKNYSKNLTISPNDLYNGQTYYFVDFYELAGLNWR